MDNLAYKVGESDAIVCKSEIPLIKTTSAKYSDAVRPVICYYRKLLCMNVKQPNVLRVLNRQGKFTDTTVCYEHVRHLTSTQSSGAHPTLFYAVGGKALSLLTPAIQATGELQVTLTEASFDEELFASAVGEQGRLFVLGQHHVFNVDEGTGAVVGKIALTPKTTVRHPTFDNHHAAKLLLVPAKSTHLDIVSTNTQRSVLNKTWEPHAGEAPTFAYFLQARRFTETADDEVLLVTAAHHNSELRFWSYNNNTKKFTLRQELTFAGKDDAVAEDFTISVTPHDEYITLASRRHGFAVVIETHRTQLKVHRVTTWKTAAPALCCASFVGKVSESVLSKSVHYELFLTIRTADGFYQSLLDANKLAGASNTDAAARNSVSAWFPEASNTTSAANANSSIQAAALTSVSSSLLGDAKTSAISEASAASIVRMQACKFNDQVKALSAELVVVQKAASTNLRMLQDSQLREEAQASGRTFAARNRSRLVRSEGAGAAAEAAEPGMMTRGQKELVQSIGNFVKEVEGASAATASTVLRTLLQKQLKQAVEKASKNSEGLEVGGTTAANISSTDAARQFRTGVDVSMKQLCTLVREFSSVMGTSLEVSARDTSAAVAKAGEYKLQLASSLCALREEVSETKVAMADLQSSAAAAAVPVDPDTLVARAVTRAESGDWAGAFTVALEASDITVLLSFLQSKVCEDNLPVISSPRTLTLPLFLSLCLQLVFEMDSQPGSIPLRVQQLHHFFVEWDDNLNNLKYQAAKDPRQAHTFEVAKRELGSVLEWISSVDTATLDRKTRNNIRLISKLIVKILSEE